jgi:hypothetical protein
MKYVSAYLLLTLGGKAADADAITQLLAAVDVEADAEELSVFLKSVEGKVRSADVHAVTISETFESSPLPIFSLRSFAGRCYFSFSHPSSVC